MEVRTCRGCGKLYNYIGSTTPACPACMKLQEEKFQRCKDYIRENPRANVQKVSEAVEVSVKMIKQWVREERLSFAEGSGVGIECEGCGAPILTGRFCNNCKTNLQSGLSQAAKRPEAPQPTKPTRDSAKMRFLDN